MSTRDGPSESTLLDAALRYAALGLRVHPLHHALDSGQCSCGGSAGSACQPGKHPRLKTWQLQASSEPNTVQRWWHMWPSANIGLLVPVRHLVFDIDPLHDGALEALGVFPTTRVARTGSGGWHVFFRLPDGIELKDLAHRARVPGLQGIDIRTERNYVVAPPSRTTRGRYYWETRYDTPIAVVPEHLLDLLRRPGRRSSATRGRAPAMTHAGTLSRQREIGEDARVQLPKSLPAPIYEGARNTTLFRLARTLWSEGLAPASILTAVKSENRVRCSPPLDDDEVRRLVASAQRYVDDGHPAYDTADALFGDLVGYRVRSRDGALIQLVQPKPSASGGDTPSEQVIAARPLRLMGRYEDGATGQQFLKIAWKESNRWHERLTERELVMNAGKLVELAAYGAPINSANARMVMEYLTAYEQANRQRLPLERATSHLGWHDPQGLGQCPLFLWGETSLGEGTLHFLPHEGDLGAAQLAAGLTAAGSLAGWVGAIELFAAYPRALLGVYVALAAPLLRNLCLPSFFVNWHCRTSLGKTTLLLAAASVAGQPDGANGLIQSWNSTQVNTERLCAVSTDLPVFLDDTKSADVRAMTRQLYRTASGLGKGRGNLAGRARVEHWRCVILATGEGRASDFTVEGGARARILEIGGLPFDSDHQTQLVGRIRAGARQHYGHALPLFVRYLINHQNEAPAWQRLHRVIRTQLAVGRSNIADRLAEYFAGVRVAAVLFHRACREEGTSLPWPIPRFEALWAEIAGASTEADADIRALNDVISWAHSHEQSFVGRHREDSIGQAIQPPSGWTGMWERSVAWSEIKFYPPSLKQALRDLGYADSEAIFGAWRERGWLRLDREGRYPQVRWRRDSHAADDAEHAADRRRCICIKREAVDQMLGGEEEGTP